MAFLLSGTLVALRIFLAVEPLHQESMSRGKSWPVFSCSFLDNRQTNNSSTAYLKIAIQEAIDNSCQRPHTHLPQPLALCHLLFLAFYLFFFFLGFWDWENMGFLGFYGHDISFVHDDYIRVYEYCMMLYFTIDRLRLVDPSSS
jgi:hypothetical protein